MTSFLCRTPCCNSRLCVRHGLFLGQPLPLLYTTRARPYHRHDEGRRRFCWSAPLSSCARLMTVPLTPSGQGRGTLSQSSTSESTHALPEANITRESLAGWLPWWPRRSARPPAEHHLGGCARREDHPASRFGVRLLRIVLFVLHGADATYRKKGAHLRELR